MSNSYGVTEQAVAEHQAKYGRKGKGLNPDAIAKAGIDRVAKEISETCQTKLIRQSGRKPNATESAYANEVLYWRKLREEIKRYEFEAVTLRLADGVRYTPDWTIWSESGSLTLIEVKGERRGNRVKARDDSVVKLKVSASQFPEWRFLLVWRDSITKEWMQQDVS